jgi:hypothetical protein
MRPFLLLPILVPILVLAAGCTGTRGDASRGRPTDDAPTTAPSNGTPIVAPVSAAPSSGADSALAAIRREGPRRVLDSLMRDTAAGSRWYNREFASGDSLWLEVARELRPATDGEWGEGLADVLGSEALLRAPRLVLRLAADSSAGFGTSICTPSFYEDTPDSVVAATTARAVAALRTVTRPELRSIRDACLAALTPSPTP